MVARYSKPRFAVDLCHSFGLIHFWREFLNERLQLIPDNRGRTPHFVYHFPSLINDLRFVGNFRIHAHGLITEFNLYGQQLSERISNVPNLSNEVTRKYIKRSPCLLQFGRLINVEIPSREVRIPALEKRKLASYATTTPLGGSKQRSRENGAFQSRWPSSGNSTIKSAFMCGSCVR